MSKKKLIFVFVIIPLFSLLAIASFTKFFGTKSATVHVTKKSYFQFDLVVSLDNIELGPGESVSIKPNIVTTDTEDAEEVEYEDPWPEWEPKENK